MSEPSVVAFDMSRSSYVKPDASELRNLVTRVYRDVVGAHEDLPSVQGDGASIVFSSAFPCWDVLDHTVSIEDFAGRELHHVWVVDSLDGSRNVAHEFPFYATTLALVDANSEESLIGLTYLPWSRETFFAIRGGDSYRNDWAPSSRLTVSNRSLADCLVYVEFPNANRPVASTGESFERECGLVTATLLKDAADTRNGDRVVRACIRREGRLRSIRGLQPHHALGDDSRRHFVGDGGERRGNRWARRRGYPPMRCRLVDSDARPSPAPRSFIGQIDEG
jgi:hypothetical protein